MEHGSLARPPGPPAMPLDVCRIVAIDCDAALGQRLLTEFSTREYDFYWFADGREALGKLQEIQPDVIICEVILPGLDGLALLETVRLWPSLRGIPFLVLSSVRSDAIIHAALEAGANAYLVKPCSVSQLKQTIHMLLESAPPRPHRDQPRNDAVSARDLAEAPSEPSEPVGRAPVSRMLLESAPPRPHRDQPRNDAVSAGALADSPSEPSEPVGRAPVSLVLENAPPPPHRDEPRNDAVSARDLADAPSEPSEPVGVTQTLTASEGALRNAPAHDLHPAAEAEAGPAVAAETGTGTPPQAKPVKARRAPVSRRKPRKRKLPAASPGPGDVAPADVGPTPLSTPPLELDADIVAKPSFWSRSRTVSWGHIPRVAAALLAIGVASDTQPRESLPSGDTDRMAMPERSEAPTAQAAPEPTPAPEAVEPSPSPLPSVEPTAEPPQVVKSVEPIVRGRLQWAQALYDEGRYDDARVALGEVIKLAPSNAQARRLAAQLERFAASLPGSAQTASEEDRRAVLALLWRFQAAVEQMDIASLKAIWPNVDPQALRERWNDERSRQRALRLIDLEVTGDEAVAMCVSYDDPAPAGDERANSTRVTFHLRRANLSWVIEDLK